MHQQANTRGDERQFSLLASLSEEPEAEDATHTETSSPTAAPAAVPAPPSLNDIFASHRATTTAIDKLMAVQMAMEKELLGSTANGTLQLPSIATIATQAIHNLIRKASTVFAPSTGPLQIDEGKVLAAVGLGDWETKYRERVHGRRGKDIDPGNPVDLDKIWSYLETRFGGDAGHVEANRQLAARLIAFLRLDNDKSVNRTSSAVVVTRRVYSEKEQFGSTRGMYKVSFSASDMLRDGFLALSSFAEHVGLDALAIAINPAHHNLGDYSYTFTPRDKVNFQGLDIVMYKEKWEFRFSHEVAEKLMLFLGEFGST